VKGDVASYDSIHGLNIVDVGEGFNDLSEEVVRNPIGTVYRMNFCGITEPWGDSYKWFRNQYHTVRLYDIHRRQSACQVAASAHGKSKSVVVHVRRGDGGGNLLMPSRKFADVLDKVFRCDAPSACVNESEAHISILAETSETDPEIREFDKYTKAAVTYFLGNPERDRGRSIERLVRDLDCMSLSDVFVMSSGSFSSLGAALQSNGVSLVTKANETYRNDVPNAKPVSLIDH